MISPNFQLSQKKKKKMSGYCAAYKTWFSASDYTYSAQFNQFCATATTLRAMITAVFVSETWTSNLLISHATPQQYDIL